MKKSISLYAFLASLFYSTSLLAYDPCAGPRQTLKNNVQECNNYRATHPNYRWDVYTAYFGIYMQQMCLGAAPADPPGAHTINFYGDYVDRNCFPYIPTTALHNPKPRKSCGSVIEVSNQAVGETIPLTGASFNLVYYSNRVEGKRSDYIVNVPVSSSVISPVVLGYNLEIKNENNNTIYNQFFSPVSNLNYSHEWNGLDANSNELWAKNKLTFIVSESATDFTPYPQTTVVYVGNLKAKKLGTGAWLPSVWHFYDSVSKTLYKGDGTVVTVTGIADGGFTRVADQKRKEIFYFDVQGKISHTKTALTGATIYTFSYDSAGRLLAITEPFNRVTTFSRYLSGVLKAIVAPNGAKASITMNADGYISKLVNPNNETYLMTYDGSGGLLKTFMPPSGDITTLTYDNVGNLISDVHSSGAASTIIKEPMGLKLISAEGKFSYTKYDIFGTESTKTASGFETRATFQNNSDQYSGPSTEHYYAYQNDPRFGNQVQLPSSISVDSFGTRHTIYTKDVNLLNSSDLFSIDTMVDTEKIHESKITSTYAGSTRTTTSVTRLGRIQKSQIDEYERPVLEQKGNLVATNFTYSDNLLTKITQGTRKKVLSYYANDLLKSIRNSLGEVTSFTYDASSRLKTKTLPDARVINYTYDSNGNLTSITPPGKSNHLFEFGLNGKMISYDPPSVMSSSNSSTTYIYNNDKQVKKIIRPDGQEIQYNYEPATGFLTSITGSFGTLSQEHSKDLVSRVMDQNGSIIFQYYDGTTQTSHRSYKDGAYIYEYDRTPNSDAGEKVAQEIIKGSGIGSVTRVINHSYDFDEYKVKVGDLDLVHDVPNGQLTQTSLGRIKDYYYYNAFGELRKYVAKYNSTVIYQYDLERDANGRVIKKTEMLNNITSVFDYTYDSAGRLIQVSTNGVVSSAYSYDSNSNRIGGTIRGESTDATYDEQDRLTSYNGTPLTYNANGELLTKGPANYVYDVLGGLREHSKGSVTVSYEIDPKQRRSGRIINGALTSRYVYNPENQVVGQLDADNKLIKTFVYATKSHVPDYYIDQKNNKFKILTDHLGSVRMVVSKTGRVLQLMEHDEFGRVLQDTRPGFLPFGFAGGLYEYRTGLVRFGARDYDPSTGRWLSKDPIKFAANDTNLYGYVMSDPVNFIDPTGLINWTQVGAGTVQFVIGGGVTVGGIALGGLVTGGSGFLGSTIGVGIGVGSIFYGYDLYSDGLNKIIDGFKDEKKSCPLNGN